MRTAHLLMPLFCLLLLAIGLIAASSGCASSSAAMSPNSGSSVFGNWTLTEMAGTSALASMPPGSNPPTLRISVDGMIFGFTGVNRLDSSVSLAELAQGEFHMGAAATTRMAGPPAAMAVESQFVSGLTSATRYQVTSSTLTLSGPAGELLQFSRTQ